MADMTGPGLGRERVGEDQVSTTANPQPQSTAPNPLLGADLSREGSRGSGEAETALLRAEANLLGRVALFAGLRL